MRVPYITEHNKHYFSEHKNKWPEDPDSPGSYWEILISVSIRISGRRILTVLDRLESPYRSFMAKILIYNTHR